MTPLLLTRETTVRPRSWPPYALTIVCGAAVAMLVSVSLVAWQASRELARYRAPSPAATVRSFTRFVTAQEFRERAEHGCRMTESMRREKTGFYAPNFAGSWQ